MYSYYYILLRKALRIMNVLYPRTLWYGSKITPLSPSLGLGNGQSVGY